LVKKDAAPVAKKKDSVLNKKLLNVVYKVDKRGKNGPMRVRELPLFGESIFVARS